MMLAGKSQITKTVWAEYKDGFQVEIRYAPRAVWVEIAERAKLRTWDAKQRKEIDTVDPVKWRAEVAKSVVAGWRGLGAETLKKIVLLDDYPDDVPFTLDDCRWLMEQSSDFENWLQTVASEAALYHAEKRQAEIKNS